MERMLTQLPLPPDTIVADAGVDQRIVRFGMRAQVAVALFITDSDWRERQTEVVASGTLLRGVARRDAMQRHLLARRAASSGSPRTRRCAGSFWIVLTCDNSDPKERTVGDARVKPDGGLEWHKT